MPSEEPEKGDKVTWNWGSGQPGGTVAEKKTEGEVAITSKRGNKIKKNAEPNNPAVHVERSGNDVVKKASELDVVEKANGTSGGAEKEEETESKAGDKRKHDEIDETPGEAEKVEEKKKDEPLEENAEGKTVKAKESNKKQKKEPAKKPTKKADTKEAEQEEKKADKEEEQPKAEKGKRGRPKKADGAPPKSKKPPTPRATEGIGSRTRSRA